MKIKYENSLDAFDINCQIKIEDMKFFSIFIVGLEYRHVSENLDILQFQSKETAINVF